jgi:hypothetical protein
LADDQACGSRSGSSRLSRRFCAQSNIYFVGKRCHKERTYKACHRGDEDLDREGSGYSRAQFGPAWADVDHNGCDTRNDILRRDLTSLTYRSGTCVILSGVLHDPYGGSVINFRRGRVTSPAVQIDHVVALSDAWQKGAFAWTFAKRLSFANDPLELLAVDGPINSQKSDSDAASWLPPMKTYRCQFVARQIAVKSKYGVWITSAERDAFGRVLAKCPKQLLPVG